MDQTEARAILASFRTEAETVGRRLSALHKLIEGLTELFPELADGSTAVDVSRPTSPTHDRLESSTEPRGQDAASRVMIESRGERYTIKKMVVELKQRGWISAESKAPTAAVRQALTRLVASDHRFQRGTDANGVAWFVYDTPALGPSDTAARLEDAVNELVNSPRTASSNGSAG